MDSELSVMKDVASYWRKVKSGELPAPSQNDIDITIRTVEAAIRRIAELEALLERNKMRVEKLIELLATPGRLPEPDELALTTEPCVICGMVSSHPEGWHYCHPKSVEGGER